MSVSAAQSTALSWVETARDGLSDDCARIFDFAEPARREYKSAAWYVERLRAEGFTVEEGSGNCQSATPFAAPRAGLGVHAAGHTDPHSALGISGLGGLLATKSAMERHDIKGGLRFTGEPAEKDPIYLAHRTARRSPKAILTSAHRGQTTRW